MSTDNKNIVTEDLEKETSKSEVHTEVKNDLKNVVGYVSGCDLLNVRKESSISSDIVAILSTGDKIEVESIDGEWAKVKSDSRSLGYCMKKYLSYVD